MKKFVRYALLLIVLVICVACSKEEPDSTLQTEHVPGTEEAVVHTPTPSPTPTASVQPTQSEEVPKVSPEPEVTPTPVPVAEEPEFMTLYRAMAPGVRINTDGIEEELLRFCFCDLELSNQARTGFMGQEELNWQQVRDLEGIRVLYYRKDGKPYICDVIAAREECETIKNCFYTMFCEKKAADGLMTSLPEALAAQGYQAGILEAGNTQYLFLYK